MAANGGENGTSESTTIAKRKGMSSNLMNMKFMQRGLDAEVAAKMQQQHVKEVSDQQWHLSIVREVDAASGPITKTEVHYEPSYNAFEIRSQGPSEPRNLLGRKTFGSFEPEIDDLLKAAQQGSDAQVSESGNAGGRQTERPERNQASPKHSKRIRGDGEVGNGTGKQKKQKRKQEAEK